MASGCGQIVDWARDHVYARPMGDGHMMDYVPLHIAAQQVQKTKAAGFAEGIEAAAKAICPSCKRGTPISSGKAVVRQHGEGVGQHTCEAWGIWQLIETAESKA